MEQVSQRRCELMGTSYGKREGASSRAPACRALILVYIRRTRGRLPFAPKHSSQGARESTALILPALSTAEVVIRRPCRIRAASAVPFARRTRNTGGHGPAVIF